MKEFFQRKNYVNRALIPVINQKKKTCNFRECMDENKVWRGFLSVKKASELICLI